MGGPRRRSRQLSRHPFRPWLLEQDGFHRQRGRELLVGPDLRMRGEVRVLLRRADLAELAADGRHLWRAGAPHRLVSVDRDTRQL